MKDLSFGCFNEEKIITIVVINFEAIYFSLNFIVNDLDY
jgi:hypothetical protein